MEVKQEKELRTLSMNEMVATDGGCVAIIAAIAGAAALAAGTAIVNNWDEFTAGYESVVS